MLPAPDSSKRLACVVVILDERDVPESGPVEAKRLSARPCAEL
jgi:hypothetical protein